MDEALYSVIPVQGGWAVEQPTGDYLMFLSGGRAEAKAYELATLKCRTGVTARVLIHDRDRRVVGQRAYTPSRASPGANEQAGRPV